jgi:N-acetyl-anhydromuramyl-L-alanine amidase AmpD
MDREHNDILVIHRCENPSDYDAYTYIIHPDGTVEQRHDEREKTPHAREFNDKAMGISCFGCFASDEPGKNWYPTPAQYSALVDLLGDLIQRLGFRSVRGHSELGPAGTSFPCKLTEGHTCPGEHLDMDLLRASLTKIPECL